MINPEIAERLAEMKMARLMAQVDALDREYLKFKQAEQKKLPQNLVLGQTPLLDLLKANNQQNNKEIPYNKDCGNRSQNFEISAKKSKTTQQKEESSEKQNKSENSEYDSHSSADWDQDEFFSDSDHSEDCHDPNDWDLDNYQELSDYYQQPEGQNQQQLEGDTQQSQETDKQLENNNQALKEKTEYNTKENQKVEVNSKKDNFHKKNKKHSEKKVFKEEIAKDIKPDLGNSQNSFLKAKKEKKKATLNFKTKNFGSQNKMSKNVEKSQQNDFLSIFTQNNRNNQQFKQIISKKSQNFGKSAKIPDPQQSLKKDFENENADLEDLTLSLKGLNLPCPKWAEGLNDQDFTDIVRKMLKK